MDRSLLRLRSSITRSGPGRWGRSDAYVSSTGEGRSWVYRYRSVDKLRDYGLGSALDVSLKDARAAADKLRSLRREGLDPIAHKRTRQAAQKIADAKAITFRQAVETYIEANRAGWKNAKHGAQWTATLATYAYPIMGAVPVGEVTTDHVVEVLTPIWSTKNETASRVRGRIESVLDYAKVRGWRAGENPAVWRGHLEQAFPARVKVAKAGHHAAMPFADVPSFMGAVSRQEGASALALRFAILTAARTGEVLGATWGEIDFDAKAWSIPADRMKAGRLHRVPLAPATLALLSMLAPANRVPSAFVFPGAKYGRPLSNMAMLTVLKRMGRSDVTSHGFRSAFRDWASETTEFSGEVAEAALAHTIRSKTEAAYRRGDLFDKRVELMTAWATFIG